MLRFAKRRTEEVGSESLPVAAYLDCALSKGSYVIASLSSFSLRPYNVDNEIPLHHKISCFDLSKKGVDGTSKSARNDDAIVFSKIKQVSNSSDDMNGAVCLKRERDLRILEKMTELLVKADSFNNC